MTYNTHTYSLNEASSLGLTMLPTRAIRLSYKNPTTKYEKHSSELLVRGFQGHIKSIGYCYCPGCFSEVESKSLLLKTPCPLDTSPRAPELDLTLKPPPSGLAFKVWEIVVPASKGGKQPQFIYPAVMPRNHKNGEPGMITLRVR